MQVSVLLFCWGVTGGQVIGINSAKISISGYEGLGFAIPINTARPIAEELVRNGSVSSRPALGVACHRLSSMASSFYGLPQGLYITGIAPGSGAFEAGLQAGDVITHINDTLVENLPSAVKIRDKLSAGDTISVTFFRRGTMITTELRLINRQMVTSDYNL